MLRVGLRPLDQPAARHDDDGTSRDTSRSALSPRHRPVKPSRGEERIDDLRSTNGTGDGQPLASLILCVSRPGLLARKRRRNEPGKHGKGGSTEISEPLHGMRRLLRPTLLGSPGPGRICLGSALDLARSSVFEKRAAQTKGEGGAN